MSKWDESKDDERTSFEGPKRPEGLDSFEGPKRPKDPPIDPDKIPDYEELIIQKIIIPPQEETEQPACDL